MLTTGAITVHKIGGPEALFWSDVEIQEPAVGEVLVRNEAIGLNFLDVYYRSGTYSAHLPFIPGHEGAGVVEAVGPDVTDFKPGDRVAYVDPIGAYTEVLLRPAGRLIKLPDFITSRQAAGMMLKGLTAEYLLHRTHRIKSSDTILVHAAAGGVGQILCQWANSLGATVIGTVGTEAKRAVAEGVGCKHVIVTSSKDFVEQVRSITRGAGVQVVYDGVGAATFLASLECLSPLGLMVAFGAASGPIPPFDVTGLATRGSLFLTRPILGAYINTPDTLRASAAALYEAVRSGAVSISVDQEYALPDAAQAHRDLQARKLTGSTVLIP